MENPDTSPPSYFVPAKKSLGQHFLNSQHVPRWMCDAAELSPGEVVVEIGPGTGVLTAELLARGVIVHAIETDSRSYQLLTERFSQQLHNKQLYLYQADIRDGLPKQMPVDSSYKVVANIPYYLSGHILRLLLETESQPSTVVLLMQKEVVERITRSRKSSILSISVEVFGSPKYVRTISPGHFSPPPKVDSAILAITNIGHYHLPYQETEKFFSLIHAGYGHKRKQLITNLKKDYAHQHLISTFTKLHIQNTARAEDLSVSDWLQLYTELHNPT